MEEELVADSNPWSTCSNSSLQPNCSSRELIEESQELKSPVSEQKNARTRKLLQKYKLSIPELKRKSENKTEVVDLALPTEKLDPWLRQKFPLMQKRATQCEQPESKVQKGLFAQENIKKELRARMAARRKVEQQRRKQLYAQDNEDVFGDNSTEDDEDKIPKKKEKMKLKAAKPVASDNSEDDEDYVAELEDAGESESSNSENDDVVNESLYVAENEIENSLSPPSLKESVDIFGSQSPFKSTGLESNQNIFKVTTPPSRAPINGPSQFPSFSQWYTSGSDKNKSLRDSDDDFADELNSTANEPINNEDLLMFCSGQFDVQPINTSEKPISSQSETVAEENDDGILLSLRKPRRLVESDDEDEAEKVQRAEQTEDNVDKEDEILEETTGIRKVILMSDDEDGEDLLNQEFLENKQETEDKTYGFEEEVFDEEEQEEEQEEDNQESEEEIEGNDSNDELAVIRRLEIKEHKRKLKKGKYFDDEASLSGSDVGSDIDEDEDGNDDYEADECDKEEFDQEELRDKNHKLFLKQQQQQVHREIAKLQDRLLADGDLAGVETNRTFRVRLREDIEIDINDFTDFSQDTPLDEDNIDEDRKRADAIKFRAEFHSFLSQADDAPADDDIERAANAASLAEISDGFSEQMTVPTLIGKAPLSGVFKDINGSLTSKQMFSNTGESTVLKRVSESPFGQPKRQKLTLFDTLDE